MKSGGNDFFSMVYDVTRQIPRGRVTSYGAIARYLGAARSARMVGRHPPGRTGTPGGQPQRPAQRKAALR
jgi:methylated-DNA-protein-cysteine methyltransferase-like protein